MKIILFLQQKQKIARNKIAMTELNSKKLVELLISTLKLLIFCLRYEVNFIEWDSIIITFYLYTCVYKSMGLKWKKIPIIHKTSKFAVQ